VSTTTVAVTLPIPQAVAWGEPGASVRILDQRHLPAEELVRELRTCDEVAEAIATLAVRGAPAIGVCAAMGLAAIARTHLAPAARDRAAFDAALAADAALLRATRPTAVNLAWAIDRLLARAAATSGDPAAVADALVVEATAVLEEDRAMCAAIGGHGAEFVPDGARVLTHCNAGALATAGIGTALAPVYTAAAMGRRVTVLADETRPLWQGARLTAWELSRAGIPVTVIADNMAASMLRAGAADVVITGADRICANGDVVNKIGTYALAIAARHHGVPVVVAAPWSTVDPASPSGEAVEIEERGRDEVARPYGLPLVPEGVAVRNPAFDVTPAALVDAIVTDRGVFRPPYRFA
jgi:methylthioribose-1-phosphate isomerase